jgi:hypothetical protein
MFIVGFTGTRDGMTWAQHKRVSEILHELRPIEVHHGCCVGADAQFHAVALWFWPVIGHPGPDGPLRAQLTGFRRLEPSKDYGERNQDIVNVCEVLIAAPKEAREMSSGGTWQTVRRARKAGKPIKIVWPDGSVAK